MTKLVYRWSLHAELSGELAFDLQDPASFTKALQHVADKRKLLQDMGATVTKDVGKPVIAKPRAAQGVER